MVGYDDISIAQHSNPPLTTIRQNGPLAGKLLAENLIQHLRTGVGHERVDPRRARRPDLRLARPPFFNPFFKSCNRLQCTTGSGLVDERWNLMFLAKT